MPFIDEKRLIAAINPARKHCVETEKKVMLKAICLCSSLKNLVNLFKYSKEMTREDANVNPL